jgi:ATP-dependent Clp protease adapter protein ClpS
MSAMNETNTPFDIDPKYPPRYRVVMQTKQELPPSLLMDVLSKTFALNMEQAQHLALSILRHEMVPHGTYSREIAEAKAFTLHQFMLQNGRTLNTSISPCL